MIRPPTLGERLSELRRKSRRDLQEVARAAGTSRQHLWRIEKGMVLNPSPAILTRIASAYGLTLADILTPPEPDIGLYGSKPRDERTQIIGRLLRHAYDMPDEDWQQLEQIATRARARLAEANGEHPG